jgi:uncharacterized membrane protein YeaQ/YmgE (transglycosylase-associated protein family)
LTSVFLFCSINVLFIANIGTYKENPLSSKLSLDILTFVSNVKRMDWSLVWTAMYGAIVGYVASRIIGGEGFGFLGNIVVGVLGSIIGKWLVDQLDIPMVKGPIGSLVSAVGGALVLILLIEFFKLKSPSKSTSTRRKK